MSVIRRNSRISAALGTAGLDFLKHAVGAFQRILPHIEVLHWREEPSPWSDRASLYGHAVWTTSDRREIEVRIEFEIEDGERRLLMASIQRRLLDAAEGRQTAVLDRREHDICGQIAAKITRVLAHRSDEPDESDDSSIRAIRDSFDEYVVAHHVGTHHRLGASVSAVFDALHTLSEQSYENRSLTFGCILDPNATTSESKGLFPKDFLSAKKFRALSDGYRTAYHVSGDGRFLNIIDLETFDRRTLSKRHYYPDWSEPVARACRNARCGIVLSRQGDILVFEEGSIRFTYRFGRWQYWNHSHLIKLLLDRASAIGIANNLRGKLVQAIYRAAIDVSFRRSGGLFVILENEGFLNQIVRGGDAMNDRGRTVADADFDRVLGDRIFWTLPRSVCVELASLDGAVVISRIGRVLAYGAVLNPKRRGRLRGTEGSRTKAAIGASNYGLALKISSDGAITVFFNGLEFIEV